MGQGVSSPPLQVAFRRFFPGFSPDDFWAPLLAQACDRAIVLSPAHKADLVITSVFEDFRAIWKRRLLSRRTTPGVPRPSRRLKPGAKQVWVTGENIRVPIDQYDLTVSFDTDSYGGTNLYWPYLLQNLEWHLQEESISYPNMNSRGVPKLEPSSLASPRHNTVTERPGFVCAFIGNPEPVRLRAINELRQFGDVQVFGNAVDRPIASKFEVAQNYRFVLAFENDVYPGYVTEKPLEAYACGAIPLWRGMDSAGLLNPKSLVNAFDFASLADFAQHVATLDSNPQQLDEIARQPLLAQTPSLHHLKSALHRVIAAPTEASHSD